jgi:hypothetical protein
MRILGISASRESAKTLFVVGVSAAPWGSFRTFAAIKSLGSVSQPRFCDLVYSAARELNLNAGT